MGNNYLKVTGKGTVLVVTLWILALLSLLAIGIGFRVSIDLKLAGYQVDSLKAYEIAKAGIIKVIAELQKDEKEETDTLWECGITLNQDETFEEKFRNLENTKMGEGHFEITCLEDAERRVNINSAPKNILMTLFPKITSEIADNIKAWGPFDALSELLLVKGVTEDIYFGTGEERGMKDLLTIYGPKEFKLNINTADEKILEAILELSNINKIIAQDIVQYRIGEDGDINLTLDNGVFTNANVVADFLTGKGVDETVVANFINSNLLIFSSNYFRIRSVGVIERGKSKIQKAITCVIKRETAPSPPHKTEIISWFEE